MARSSLRLRTIALVAAYAVALQGLLVAFVPLPAFSAAGVLCSGASASESVPAGAPGHEVACQSVCVMFGAAAAPTTPDIVAVAPKIRSVTVPMFAAILSVAPPRGLHAARAPPAV